MSLRTLQEMQKNGTFQQTLIVGALNQVLTGLNFLYEADVIHTGKYIPSLSSADAIFPADQQTIRPPLRQSAYYPYGRFYPHQSRRGRNPRAISKEASRRYHYLRLSVYTSRCRVAHHQQLRASPHRQRAQWECHAGAVSSTRGYSQQEVGKCRGHVERRAFSMESSLFISHGSIL
jgi:hypothetical protein